MRKLLSCFVFCLLSCLTGCLGYSSRVSDTVNSSTIYKITYGTPMFGENFIEVSFWNALPNAVISSKDLELINAGTCTVVVAQRRLSSIYQPDDTVISVIPEGTPDAR